MAKILSVDDAAFMRNIIKRTLGTAGYTEIYEAVDGYHAIKQIKPDLVLLDITMPNLDGLNTLRVIRTIDPMAS